MIVSVSPIKLARRELWVVSQIDTLIAELLTNFENTVHATDDQHLKIELWCDSHEEFHVQVVVESLEGLGCGTASNHVHHWRLDFCEVFLTEEVSQEIQNLVTSSENVVDWVVQDQVQVSLSVTSVLGQDLLLAVTLGQHVHAVGETDDLGWSDRELASLGAAWAALDSNDVTTAERGVQSGELTLVEVLLSQDLNLSTITLQIDEDEGSTGTTDSKNTSGESNGLILNECVVLCDSLVILLSELVDAMSTSEFVRVRVFTSITFGLDKILPIVSIL